MALAIFRYGPSLKGTDRFVKTDATLFSGVAWPVTSNGSIALLSMGA